MTPGAAADAGGGVPGDWTVHRRDDGELVGWIRPDGDAWTAIDLLGREAVASVDWLDAEAALEERGIGYLADVWMLEREGGTPLRVRMLEVTPARIVVKVDDYGDVSRATDTPGVSSTAVGIRTIASHPARTSGTSNTAAQP